MASPGRTSSPQQNTDHTTQFNQVRHSDTNNTQSTKGATAKGRQPGDLNRTPATPGPQMDRYECRSCRAACRREVLVPLAPDLRPLPRTQR